MVESGASNRANVLLSSHDAQCFCPSQRYRHAEGDACGRGLGEGGPVDRRPRSAGHSARQYPRTQPDLASNASVQITRRSESKCVLDCQVFRGVQSEDVDAALAAWDETFHIDRDDLERLLRQADLQAMVRSHRTLLCRNIMSRDEISVPENATADDARSCFSTATSAPCR